MSTTTLTTGRMRLMDNIIKREDVSLYQDRFLGIVSLATITAVVEVQSFQQDIARKFL
jgi:hypothetical protein